MYHHDSSSFLAKCIFPWQDCCRRHDACFAVEGPTIDTITSVERMSSPREGSESSFLSETETTASIIGEPRHVETGATTRTSTWRPLGCLLAQPRRATWKMGGVHDKITSSAAWRCQASPGGQPGAVPSHARDPRAYLADDFFVRDPECSSSPAFPPIVAVSTLTTISWQSTIMRYGGWRWEQPALRWYLSTFRARSGCA